MTRRMFYIVSIDIEKNVLDACCPDVDDMCETLFGLDEIKKLLQPEEQLSFPSSTVSIKTNIRYVILFEDLVISKDEEHWMDG